MRKINPTPYVLIILFLFCGLSSSFSQVKYNAEDFKNIKKIASKIAKVNAKNLVKHNVKKVMIYEFFGDFMTSKETSPSAFEKRHSNWYIEKKMSVEIGGDYYETMTNMIYDMVVKIFEENGIEVLDKEILLNNEDYIALGLKEEKTRKGYTGGVMKKSTTTKSTVRSVTGMGMFSETLRIGAVTKINKMIPKIAKDNGCQAAIKVKFIIGLGKKNVPSLNSINCTMDSNLGEYNAGRGKVTYAWKNGGVALFTTNKGLTSTENISGASKGEIDMDKYTKVIMDQVKGMCDAYSYLLKSQLK